MRLCKLVETIQYFDKLQWMFILIEWYQASRGYQASTYVQVQASLLGGVQQMNVGGQKWLNVSITFMARAHLGYVYDDEASIQWARIVRGMGMTSTI